MLGDDSDEEDQKGKSEERRENSRTNDTSCSWGMGKTLFGENAAKLPSLKLVSC